MTIMHSTQKIKNDKDHHHHYDNAQDNDDNDDKMSKIDSSHSNSGSGYRLSEFVTSTVESDKRSSYESDKELLGKNNMLRRSHCNNQCF